MSRSHSEERDLSTAELDAVFESLEGSTSLENDFTVSVVGSDPSCSYSNLDPFQTNAVGPHDYVYSKISDKDAFMGAPADAMEEGLDDNDDSSSSSSEIDSDSADSETTSAEKINDTNSHSTPVKMDSSENSDSETHDSNSDTMKLPEFINLSETNQNKEGVNGATENFTLSFDSEIDQSITGGLSAEILSENSRKEDQESIPQYDVSDDSNASEFSDDDSSDDEIVDELLEQDLLSNQKVWKKNRSADNNDKKRVDKEYNEKEIIVLEEKGKNTFEVLPGGWIEIRHSSGMPLYLHRKTRTCTLAKPYFIGPASVRRHSIPLSAIPCMAYRRALQEEGEATPPVSEEPIVQCPVTDEHPDHPIGEKQQFFLRSIPEFPPRSSGLDPPGPGGSEIHPDSSSRKQRLEFLKNGRKRVKLNVGVVNGEDRNSDSVTSSTDNQDISFAGKEPTTLSDATESAPMNILPLATVATAKENNSIYSVSASELRQYCETLFKFKSVKCKRFKTWSARRKHTKEQKRLQLQRPSLPEGVKLISFPVHNGGGNNDGAKGSKEYIMNPQGKSSVCILHEYVQHALRKQPSYIFKELENASTPYAATVVINSMQYGTGYGSSKKQAKADAAKATLEILIPQMKEQLDGKKGESSTEFDILTFFESFGLSDVAISKWCKNFSEPPPYGLLLTCLQRNFGQGMSNNVKFEMIATGSQSNRFQMQVGEHTVEVTAANKREGKQLASQHLLSKLHPHIKNFGAFIKLYGNSSIKSVKEKKQEEQQITTLQSKASANSPNWAILNKLKEEMLKLLNQADKVDKPKEPGSNDVAQGDKEDKAPKNTVKPPHGSCKPQNSSCDKEKVDEDKSTFSAIASVNENEIRQCDKVVPNIKRARKRKQKSSQKDATTLKETVPPKLTKPSVIEREEGEASP